MQWWAWITVGAILLGSELTFVNAQFYLVFIGGAALVVGILDLAGAPLADWLQWVLFASLGAVSLAAFRSRVYARLSRKLPAVKAGPEGELVILPQALPPGASCRLEHRGSSWSAVNGGRITLEAGATARVARVDGLTLVVHSS
ncbi:MAG TPA: NfeD family protein [Steroidobacteraceae bacterium]|jgi:membrane protein implicated in regulation of membrane protease activity|nr:NfeD family protein [Steroidobacteraceae bacterium]